MESFQSSGRRSTLPKEGKCAASVGRWNVTVCVVKRCGRLSPAMAEQRAGAGSVSTAAEMFGQVRDLSGPVDARAVLPQLISISQRPLRTHLSIITAGYSATRIFSGYFQLHLAQFRPQCVGCCSDSPVELVNVFNVSKQGAHLLRPYGQIVHIYDVGQVVLEKSTEPHVIIERPPTFLPSNQ